MFKFLFFILAFAGTAIAQPKRIVLNSSNSVLMMEDFNPISVAKTVSELAAKDLILPPGQPLYLVLQTPGGSIDAGLEMIENLRGFQRPVHTITVSAASMGFIVAQQMNRRLILESGELMSHRARGGFRGQFPGEANTRLDHWMNRVTRLEAQIARRSGRSLENYRALIKDEYWCEGYKCVRDGFADEVVVVSCDSTLAGKEEKIIKDTFMGLTIITKLQMPKCPTRTYPIDYDIVVDGKSIFETKPFSLSDKEVALIVDYVQKRHSLFSSPKEIIKNKSK